MLPSGDKVFVGRQLADPSTPGTPSQPRTVLYVVSGAVSGILLGLLAALLIGRARRTRVAARAVRAATDAADARRDVRVADPLGQSIR